MHAMPANVSNLPLIKFRVQKTLVGAYLWEVVIIHEHLLTLL